MKINAIRSVCMEAKCMQLLTNSQGAVCWIGTGTAAYPAEVSITEDDVQALFGLTDKQMEKLHVYTRPIEGSWLEGAGAMTEPLTDERMLDVNINGSVACFLADKTLGTLWAYDRRLTKPIPTCYERSYELTANESGEQLIMCYEGNRLAAIIKPMHKGITKKLTELMAQMATMEVGET